EYVGPGVAVDWFEVEGPILDEWPPASHCRLFGDLPLVELPPPPKAKAKGKGKEKPGHDIHVPSRPPEAAFHPQLRGLSRTRIEFSTPDSQEPEADARRL